MLFTVLLAALLEPSAFERLRQSESSVMYALGTVLVAALSFGAGVLVYGYRVVDGVAPPISTFPIAMATVFIGWVVWTFVSYFIGTGFLGGKGTWREMLHALGICFGPGIIMASIAIPAAGPIGFSFATFWVLAAGMIAARETQQTTLRRVIFPTVIGWIPLLFLTWMFIFFIGEYPINE